MKIKRRLPLILGAALPGVVMLSLPGEAVAQSASAAAMLEEVVVTARRREENLQDLPISIQAISADAMQAQGIYNIEAITDFVPNLELQDDIRSNDTRIFIRGVGGGFSNPAQVFGVGMYVDGHYMSGTLGAFMSTVDVERVEVLRGPQGTLFGKNTTGGAVSLISAKPHDEFESYVTLRAGEFGQQDVRGMVNVPLTDSLFFRGNVAKESSDGYYYNRLLDQDTGGYDQSSIGLALRWEVSDSWLLDARLGLAEDRDDNRGGQCFPYPDQDLYDVLTDPAYLAAYAGPGGVATPYTGPGPFNDEEAVARWGGQGGGTTPGGHIDAVYVGAALDYINGCVTDSSMGPWVTSQDMPNTFSDVDNNMFNLNATWSAPGSLGTFENATVQIQGAWRETGYWYMQDRDFSPFIIDHVGNYGGDSNNQGVNRRTDEFEVIFNGDINDRAHLTAGFYWFDDIAQTGNNTCLGAWRNAYDADARFPGDDGILNTDDDLLGSINGLEDDNVTCQPEGGTLMPRLPGTGRSGITNSYGRTTGESTAIYAHLTYELSDQWEMAVGARAMQDDRTQNNIELDITQGANDCLVADANSFCSPTILMNRQTVINTGVYVEAESDDSAVTPSLSFTRHLEAGDMLDSGNVYFSVSQGYLTGAINDEIPVNQMPDAGSKALAASLIPYEPEEVTNYEVGFKGTLLDGRLRLATALFYMDYTDKQEAISIDNPDGLLGPNEGLEYTDNVGEVGITGIEFELRASPWEDGFVSLDLGYLDYDYKEFSFVNIALDPPQVIEGLPPLGNLTPDWTITATVEHAFELGNGATLTPQLGVYMQDDYEWSSSLAASGRVLAPGEASINCHQDSYSKFRARLTYEPAGGAWQASLFGYNITDEEILQGCGATRTGTYRWYHEAPAQWGAEFTMRFGNNT